VRRDIFVHPAPSLPATDCNDLLFGYYECFPEIDPETQEIRGCNVSGKASVRCEAAEGVECANDTKEFFKTVDCRYTNGYQYKTTVILSIFLGWLGVDRFYLGYPAMGLLKLSTFGLCGLGAFVDFMLIALQVVVPADGSNYVIDHYGPRLTKMSVNEETYFHYNH